MPAVDSATVLESLFWRVLFKFHQCFSRTSITFRSQRKQTLLDGLIASTTTLEIGFCFQQHRQGSGVAKGSRTAQRGVLPQIVHRFVDVGEER